MHKEISEYNFSRINKILNLIFAFLACANQCARIDCKPDHDCVNLPNECSAKCVNRKSLNLILPISDDG